MSEPTVRQIGRASRGRGPSTPVSFCLEEVPMPATRRSQFSGRRSCESRVPVKCVDVDIGDSHDPQGESGLARHGSRRQRRPLHRFRCTRPDSLWHSPFSCRAEATPPRNSAPRRPSLWTRTARAFASPARLCRCTPTCRTWTKPRSPEWLGKPRKTARSPRSLTPKSHSTPS
jgi:hypothetical protein